MYDLSFILEKDFEKHVSEVIDSYNNALADIDLKKFNSNVIDPIKLLFDKEVYNKDWKDVINSEIQRQIDKTNNNTIGYFHQNLFKYIDCCKVPKNGWDIIVKKPNEPTIYVEMKNKHNTMNSSSSQKTYIGMQNQILEEPDSKCFLVETLAPESRNIIWKCSVNKKSVENKNIRRVSMDKFYSYVTDEEEAFFKLCRQLPKTIEKLIKNKELYKRNLKNTVIEELEYINNDMLTSLYILAFETYEGFKRL